MFKHKIWNTYSQCCASANSAEQSEDQQLDHSLGEAGSRVEGQVKQSTRLDDGPSAVQFTQRTKK